jgi:cytochrome d ubiquinol oxidase subunit II
VGALAVALCAALAAIFLAVEMTRAGEPELAASFGRRGLWATTAAGALALVALAVTSGAAPRLFDGLTGRALPEVLSAIVAGSVAVGALWRRRYRLARASIGLSAAAIVWGWGIAQYPRLVGPGAHRRQRAASGPELTAIAIALGAGLLILAPSLWLLYGGVPTTPRGGNDMIRQLIRTQREDPCPQPHPRSSPSPWPPRGCSTSTQATPPSPTTSPSPWRSARSL